MEQDVEEYDIGLYFRTRVMAAMNRLWIGLQQAGEAGSTDVDEMVHEVYAQELREICLEQKQLEEQQAANRHPFVMFVSLYAKMYQRSAQKDWQ